MSTIPMRDYVVSGLVTAETVNALVEFGEPMLVDGRGEETWYWPTTPFRAWLRFSKSSRTQGPLAATPQGAADGLLAKVQR